MPCIKTVHNTWLNLDQSGRPVHKHLTDYNTLLTGITNKRNISIQHGKTFMVYSDAAKAFMMSQNPCEYEIFANPDNSFSIFRNGEYLSARRDGSLGWVQNNMAWEHFTFDDINTDVQTVKDAFAAFARQCPGKLSLVCGCGRRFYGDTWFHTDYNADIQKKIYFLDLSKRFVFEECSFAYIYGEHVLEHLNIFGLINFFNEACRVLKPGGVLRFANPCLEKWIAYYITNDDFNDAITEYSYINFMHWLPKMNFRSKAIVINNAMHNWGHKLILDFLTYKQLLLQAGFKHVIQEKPHHSTHKELQDIETRKDFYSDYETLVIEAQK